MRKRTWGLLVASCVVASQGFAAMERVVRFENYVRVGYDDNIYSQNDKTGSAFITDILNVSGKFNFSSRTDAQLSWIPEFRYRFDGDPEFITYQSLYARLNHALSQRVFLTISDRFRYQIDEFEITPQLGGGDQNYFENDLMGALDINVNSLSVVKLGAGYEFRVWDNSQYGKGTRRNDYDKFKANASYIRDLKANTTRGLLGLNYEDHQFAGSRGGYSAVTVYGGVDQNFNPNLTGFGQLGYTFSQLDGTTESDSSAPYVQAGLGYSPTARTSLNGSLGYSIYQAENSFYNAQDRFNLRLGASHDITAKITIDSFVSYIFGWYDSDFYWNDPSNPQAVGDVEDQWFTFSVRGSYQINRNNFLQAGYQYSVRSVDSDAATFTDYNRNIVDVGWKLRL